MSAHRLPEIIAHRGASRACRENTMGAFRQALEEKADGIELDVHGTADGVLVVHHDSTINGRELSTLMAREVAEHVLPGQETIPTLDEVLALVADQAIVYVEVKARRVEELVVACLDRHPAVQTAVHAFDHRIPVAVRAQRGGTSIGILSYSYPLDMDAVIRAARPDALWQFAPLIDDAIVRDAHRHGARVIAWTENDPVHAHHLMQLGVDGLCTDIPGELRAALLAMCEPDRAVRRVQ